MINNLAKFIANELEAVDGRSRRSWVNLTFRTGAAYLGKRYLETYDVTVEANIALFELLIFGSHTLFALFALVLVIEFVKALVHFLDKTRRLARGKALCLVALSDNKARPIVADFTTARTVIRESPSGDGRRGGYERCLERGLVSELPEHNNNRYFKLDGSLYEYLQVDAKARAKLLAP